MEHHIEDYEADGKLLREEDGREPFVKNLLKGLAVAAVGDVAAYVFYLIFLSARNNDHPDQAHWPTILFSLIFYALTVYAALRVLLSENPDTEKIDEKKRIQAAYKKAGYRDLDYEAYYKDAFKKRILSYPLAMVLAQLPLTVFYLILQIVGNAGSALYELKYPFYRFFLPALYGYELTYQFWAGLLIYSAVTFAVFFFFPQRAMKKWLVKPSYVK